MNNSKHNFRSQSSFRPSPSSPLLPPHCGIWKYPDGTIQVALRLDGSSRLSHVTISPDPPNRYITIREAAARLSVSARYIREHFKERLVSLGNGRGNDLRIAEADLEMFAKSRRAI